MYAIFARFPEKARKHALKFKYKSGTGHNDEGPRDRAHYCPLGRCFQALEKPLAMYAPAPMDVALTLIDRGFNGFDDPEYRTIVHEANDFINVWDHGRIPLDKLPEAMGLA